MIIGADGRMNSIARKYVLGDNQPIYQNYINWVGILESDTPLAISDHVLDYWGCGERFGIVPISNKKVYWAGCKVLPLNSINTEKTDKLELLKIFRDWPELINTVITKTQDQNITKIPVFDHDPNKNWFKNQVCLLGDAAHASLPTSGQGACQAIEDSWHLAELMAIHQTLPEVFNAYLNIRFNKTTAITLSAREFANSIFNKNEQYCLERNNRAKVTDYQKTVEGMIDFWSNTILK